MGTVKHSQCSLIVLQPVLYDYRLKVFANLNDLVSTHIVSVLKCAHPSCAFVDMSGVNSSFWPLEVLKVLLSSSGQRVAFVPAYTNHVGILLSACLFWILRIPIVIHGQALFKKPLPNSLDNLISLFWLSIANRYIAYSMIGLHGPFSNPFFQGRVSVVLNRFESLDSLGLSDCQPPFDSFVGMNTSLRILFVGRDRPGTRLDLAFELVSSLRNSGYLIHLDVIGVESPPQEGIVFHGPLQSKTFVDLAMDCHIGLYPGDSGLSVLHYMALGLCPVVHGDIRNHSGPEPSYVEDGVTGFLFNRSSLDSLVATVRGLYDNPSLLAQLRRNARSKAVEIHRKPLSRELFDLIMPFFAGRY
jgi:glycosyltransferase involved in cell wall biosynthesis